VLVKPDHPGLRTGRQSADSLVATVQNREIVAAGELDRARLDVDVPLERAVAVQVVRSEVEDHADMEARPVNRLQLEARKLEHHPVPGRDLFQAVEHRVADVAAHDDRPVARREHDSGECGGRGLAVGACDPDHCAGAEL